MSAAIILGGSLSNLTPDGPDCRTRDVNMSLSTGSAGLKVELRFNIVQANAETGLPTFGAALSNTIYGGTVPTTPYDFTACYFRGWRETTDDTGRLSKITLLYWNNAWDSASIGIASGETLYELDQSMAQVPIERAPYWLTTAGAMVAQDFAEVKECLESGHFTGTGFDGTTPLGDDGTNFYWEILGSPAPAIYNLTGMSRELVIEKLKGNDYLLRPLIVFRKTTTATSPSWTTLTASSGKLVITPVTVVTGSTKDNWLYNAARAERRRANGQTFHSQTEEWIYNPDKWDVTPYRFYAAP